jgi:GntR family transcriptional repressor for pyruvate dehydrogenase complex
MVKPIAFPPSARRNRAETVVEKLRREILNGRHQPGTRLPPERELALRFTTNRNTLREALRTLESENLVRARQGDGTLVLDWRATGEITLLPYFLSDEAMNEERFSALITLLHLRHALVDQALGGAAKSADDVDLRALRSALDQLRAAEPGLPTVLADIEFYRRIILTAHSVVLVWVFNTFARIFEQLGERYPELWTVDEDYTARLEEVVRSLVAGKGNRARDQMRELLNLRNGDLLKQLVPSSEDTLPPSETVKPKTSKRKRK